MEVNANYEPTTNDSSDDFEVTVTGPNTPEQFIQFLSDQNFTGHTGYNPNYPGMGRSGSSNYKAIH